MFNFFIIMDEIQGNNIARNFSSEYFNYTINFIISKEFPALTDFPDFSLILCDLDKNIELAKKHNLPVIAFSHKTVRISEKPLPLCRKTGPSRPEGKRRRHNKLQRLPGFA